MLDIDASLIEGAQLRITHKPTLGMFIPQPRNPWL